MAVVDSEPSLPIARQAGRSLRDGVRNAIVQQISRGKFAPGQRLNLADLSRVMGVSPTPIREALTQLQQDGLVRAERNLGFFVPELSVDHLEETYPILAVLEGLAVRNVSPHPALAVSLREANAALARASSDPAAAFEADLRWHRRLVEECGNRTLLHEIARLRRRIASSELAFMRQAGELPGSVADHESVTELLEAGRQGQAARALRSHWNRSVVFVRSKGRREARS